MDIEKKIQKEAAEEKEDKEAKTKETGIVIDDDDDDFEEFVKECRFSTFFPNDDRY